MKIRVKKIILAVYSKMKFLFKKQPQKITANVIQLAENELLSDKVAVVTGATSGIGFAIADAMLRANVRAICITGRTEERCRNAVEKLMNMGTDRGGRVFYEVMDVRDVKSFDKHLINIQNKIGHLKIDILCNNAGVQGAHYMIDNKIEGNILNIASSSSLRPTNSAYSLSKACMKELTAGMGKFLIPYGIVVNGLAPGPTATPLMNKDSTSSIEHSSNPTGRYALPEEIANMAVVLTSGMGRMIVGSIIYMTGGAGNITFDDSKYKF